MFLTFIPDEPLREWIATQHDRAVQIHKSPWDRIGRFPSGFC